MKKKFTFLMTAMALIFAIMGPRSVAWGQNYQLVTSTSDLVAGCKYLIGNSTSGEDVKFMSTESNTNNRKVTSGTVSNDGIVSLTNEMLVLELGGSTGAWTLKTTNYLGTNGYLASAASGNNNYCRVIADETTATISFSENAAVITIQPHTSRNILRYNSSASCFACYSSGQSAVYLYKEITSSKTLTSLAVSGTPTKTEYEAGEEFDPAGLVVTGTYTEGDPEEITSGIDWTITPNPLTAGTTSVSVTAKVGEVESPAYQVNGLTVTEFVQTYANTYTSDASLSSVITGSKVKWEGCKEPNGYNALKIGKGGTATITVPAGTKTVHLHMVAWNGESDAVTVKLGSTTLPSITPTADAGVSGSSTTYTIATEPKTENSYYFPIEVNTDEEATLSLTTASSKRAILFGVNFEADTEPSITADVEEIEFEQKELDGTVTDSKVISATGKNLTAPISASMKDGSAAVFSVVANGTPTAAEGEFTVSYSTTEAGEYAGTVVLSSGETSIEIPVSASVVAHIPVLQSIAVSGTPTKTEYNEGEEFDPAGLTVTGTYDVGEPQPITEGIDWTITPSGALTAGTTSVSVTAKVGDITSNAYQVNDLTVTAAQKWAKVTDDKTDWSGEYLLVYENNSTAYVWTGVDAADCNATATISNNQITKPADAVSLTIASMDGGYSILVNGGTNDGKYIYGTSGSNKINFGTTASLNTIAYPYADGNNSVKIVSNTATMRYNNASNNNRFRYFGSAGQQNIQLYEKVLAPTNEAVTFAAPTDGTLVIKNGATPISSGATIQNGTVLDVTFGMTPAEAYKDVAIKVTKTDGGDDVTSTVYDAETKKITMPRYAITVAVTFTKLYKITLATDGEGTGTATMNGVTTDIYVDGETQIDLVANAVAPNEFTKWSATENISIDAENEAETYAIASGDGTITATFGISALQPLGTPTLSNPTNITYSGVTLNWEELANAEAYNVELLLDDETVASDVITGATSWTPEVTLQANTTYTYTVQGVGDGITYAIDNNPKATSSFTTDDYPAVVLTLSENGFTSTKNGKLNTPITLPTTSTQACDGKVFVGWSATTIDDETDAEPSLLGETYTFTNPEQLTATIYAVYAKETPGEAQTVFSENFDACTGTGGNDDQWSGSIANTTLPESITGWIFTKEYAADQCAKFGTSSAAGSAKTPAIEFTGKATLTFRAGAWSGDAKTLNITTTSGTATPASVTLIDAAFTSYEIVITGATENPQITFAAAQASKNRFFLDDVVVKTAGAPTYSKYCTTAPIVISENTVWDGNVTINGNTTVTIESDAILTVKGVLTNTNADNLIIEDGAQLIHDNSLVAATIRKTVTGYGESQGRDHYNLFVVPTTGTEIATGTNLTEGDYDLYRYDEPTHYWENHKGTLSFEALGAGGGFLYANKNDMTVELTGTLYKTNDYRVNNCTYTAEDNPLSGFNLLGNPFSCNAYVSLYSELTSYQPTTYLRMNEDGSGFESFDCSEPVKVGEGIFVQIPNPDDAEGTTYSVGFYRENLFAESSKGSLNVTVSKAERGASVINNALVCFGEGFNTEKFMLNPENTKIYIPQNGKEYGAVFTQAEGELPVDFKAEKNGTYTISVNTENVEANYLHLIDNMTGMDTDLLSTPSYTFDAKTSDYASRFKLVFSMNDVESNQVEANSFAYINNGEIIISNEGRATLQVIDVMGRIVSSEEINGECRISTNGLTAGLYILNLNGMTQKIVVR